MSRKIFGLDIRNDAVSAVLVNSSIKGNWIEAHAYVPLEYAERPEETMENRIERGLERVLNMVNPSGAFCVVSLPPEQVLLRNIQVPFKEQKKIRQILPYELEILMPLPVEDLIVDFHITTLSDSSDHTDLIAAAVEKIYLQHFLEILAAFNIEPDIVTPGGFSTALYLANLSLMPEKWLLINGEPNQYTIFLVIKGQVCLVRSLPFNSGDSLQVESLQSEINRTLTAFGEIYTDELEIDGLFVVYDSSEGDHFINAMKQISAVPVNRVNLLGDSKLIKKDYLTPSSNTGIPENALGLVLAEIAGVKILNFRRDQFAHKRQWVEHKTSLIMTSILVGVVLLMIYLNAMIDFYGMEKKLTGLNRQITQIFRTILPEARIVDPVHQVRQKLISMRKESFLTDEDEKLNRTIDILNEISKRIPHTTEVEFTKLILGPESLVIDGVTDTFNSVDDLKHQLEKATIFQNVTISSANLDKSGKRVRFKLRVNR
jgi:hypothetical protein